MQMVPVSSASFFKIMLDPSSHHLQLPPAFVSKHLKNKIPKNPKLKCKNGGFSWNLKVKQIDGVYCFADGWNNVVKDLKLSYGDFLVFRLVGRSTFNVWIYSPNGCEKEFYSEVKVEHAVDVDDVDGHQEEDDDDLVHENENDADENDKDDDDDAYEDEDGGEEEEDDDDDDDDDEEEEEEEEDNDDDYDDDKVVVCDDDEDDGVEEEEVEEEDEGDGDIDGHDGDPFFITVISKTNQHLMRLPAKFLRLAGKDGEKKMTVKDPVEKEWEMSLRSEQSGQSKRYYLTSGWKQFFLSNELSEGDKCVFKFIKSEDILCLAKVTRKKPRPATADVAVKTKRKRRRRW